MSTGSETLERVADLLPPEQRERLLRIALKFRNLPEEDEFLQVLEAIGLMTLLWSQIPREIHSILEGAKPAQPNMEFVNTQIRSAIQENIPSFGDLRQISQSLQNQQAVLKRHFQSPVRSSSPKGRWQHFLLGLFAGLLVAAFIIHSKWFPIP